MSLEHGSFSWESWAGGEERGRGFRIQYFHGKPAASASTTGEAKTGMGGTRGAALASETPQRFGRLHGQLSPPLPPLPRASSHHFTFFLPFCV